MGVGSIKFTVGLDRVKALFHLNDSMILNL